LLQVAANHAATFQTMNIYYRAPVRAAAPSVDRRSDPVTETAFTGCARAPAHCIAVLQVLLQL